MPQLISTPEEWFRNQGRDLYLICRNESQGKFSKRKYIADQKILHAWFAKNLPNTSIDIIGVSENSGWITGGPNYLTANFDSMGLAIFNAEWGSGTPWQIETLSFSEWRKRVESVNLLSSPGCDAKRVRWWDSCTSTR